MTTFLLIRHGETDAIGKSMMGWLPGWHLNNNGNEQVKRLAVSLASHPIQAVYTSPLERAIETAAAIAKAHGIEPQPVQDLGEFHMGEWQGLTMEQLDGRDDWKRFNTLRSGTRAPGGELMIETQARMLRQIEALSDRHPGKTVAVVSHGDPLRALLAYFLGIPMDLLLRFEIFPASVSVVQAGEWAPRVLCLNYTGDIPQ